MDETISDAAEAFRRALSSPDSTVNVALMVSRSLAEKLLRFLEAEHSSGTVVVPVKELYTTTESASMLGISRASLMKLIDSGEIEAVMVGTHHRLPADELLAYQRARQVSHGRASEILNEFSARSGEFQSNVKFSSERSRPRRARVDREETE